MKQVIRRVIDSKGKIKIIELPAPEIDENQILVQNAYSLISTGTEMSTISKTPVELVKQTLSDPWMRNAVNQTIFSAGIKQTADRVWQELISPREIGYSGAGIVLAIGKNVEGIKVGDTVAYAATGHAEVVAPHINHVVSVPKEVSLKHAAFVTVAGIAMQSLRRAEIQFGEVVTIFGLGLVGQIAAMISKAAGAVVVGIDHDDKRLAIAETNGIDLTINPNKQDLKSTIMEFTSKNGVDATIICASSKSDTIVNSSMEITRAQGRVVLVGYVGLDIHPKNFLYNEIDLRYSRAYGPGSYHRPYEKGNVDYPFGYVRWTEKRNLQEVIRLIEIGALNLDSLIGKTYTLDNTQQAFDDLSSGSMGGVAALLDYQVDKKNPDILNKTIIVDPKRVESKNNVGLSLIGTGNHALVSHLPNINSMNDVELRGLVSATGKNAEMVKTRYKPVFISTDIQSVLDDPHTDGVLICTTHDKHFNEIKLLVEAKIPTFVEKPTVLTFEELKEIYKLLDKNPIIFTVGLNRRYSKYVSWLRQNMNEPINYVAYEVAVPYIPKDHWSIDEFSGGGRLIAEGEHFINLCNVLIGKKPVSVSANYLGNEPDDLRKLVNYSVNISYGSAVANLTFYESGSANYPREKITAFSNGQVGTITGFSYAEIHGTKGAKLGNGKKADMGHKTALHEFVKAIKGESNDMMTWEESAQASICMFAAQESIRSGCAINYDDYENSLKDG